MVLIAACCPSYHSDYLIQGGKTLIEPQRYRGHHAACSHDSFVLNPAHTGCWPAIKAPSAS